jgi:hypothetical protein
LRRIDGLIARIAFLLAFGVFLAFSSSAQTSNRTSTSIQLTVYVPSVLQLSLDFGNAGVAQINGYLGNSLGSMQGSFAQGGFALASNSTFSLGNAKIVSNLGSSYSISVQSMNSGRLKNFASGSEISYSLLIGGVPTMQYGDAFRMTSSLRTPREGIELPVSIALGTIPTNAAFGAYTDNLLFNVSAN